jgi:uncharacterized membrane protein SirB2
LLSSYLAAIRSLHVSCVALSGGLFCVRGLMRLCSMPAANHRMLRYVSYGIDTTLLLAAVLLTLILHEFPFADAWLTTKLALLMLYIVLGSFALKRASTRVGQAAAFLAALTTFGWIIGVAIAHQPSGWLVLLRR